MYVVAGVSGRTGAVVADDLLRSGEQVRVIVRDPAKGEPWRARGAEVAVASLDETSALTRALEGAAGAYVLLPEDPRTTDPFRDARRMVEAIAEAARDSALPHLVLLSVLDAPLAGKAGIISALTAAEQRLGQVPAPVTITFLRAATFMESWAAMLPAIAEGALPTFIDPDRVVVTVSVRDVGALAARVLRQGPPARSPAVLELAGPEDFSPRRLAGVLSELRGKPVTAQPVPGEAVVPILTSQGISPQLAEQVRLLYQAIGRGEVVTPGERPGLLRGQVSARDLFGSLLGSAI
jgi:uncharacterized protein YbjT (DUF2867 family)